MNQKFIITSQHWHDLGDECLFRFEGTRDEAEKVKKQFEAKEGLTRNVYLETLDEWFEGLRKVSQQKGGKP